MDLAGVGMVTPVGLDSGASCAALRAGIQRLRETGYRDNRARLVVGAEVREIRSPRKGLRRLLDLAVPALREALANAAVDDGERLALLLCVQESARPWSDGRPLESLADELQRSLGFAFRAGIEVRASGSAGTLDALRRARSLLRNGAADTVVVGGVDSLLTQATVDWYQKHDRLKQSVNPDGLIPGEGAAFTVWRESWPGAGVRLAGVACELEPAHVTAPGPNRGEGLSRVLVACLRDARLGADQVSYRVSDLTGERFGFVEHALAAIRIFRLPMEECPHWHLAPSVGCMGAAGGAALGAWAGVAWQRGYAPGPHALCIATSDDGLRAAAILSARS